MTIKFYYPFLSPPFFIFIFLVRLVTPMLKLVYRTTVKWLYWTIGHAQLLTQHWSDPWFKPSKKGSFALHDATLTLVFFNPFFLKDFEYDLNGKELSAQETLEVKVKDWEKIGPNRWVKRYHRLRLLQPWSVYLCCLNILITIRKLN